MGIPASWRAGLSVTSPRLSCPQSQPELLALQSLMRPTHNIAKIYFTRHCDFFQVSLMGTRNDVFSEGV
jgi:hypothetical protein